MDRVTLKALITSVLKELNLHSDNAVKLLMGTAAQESHLGKYRKQLGGGPALGIFQMEPATFNDIVNNYLRYKPALAARIERVARVCRFKAEDVENNDLLAICMARVHYLRASEAIPPDVEGMARYWKRYYNTPLGKGTVEEFIANYRRLVG